MKFLHAEFVLLMALAGLFAVASQWLAVGGAERLGGVEAIVNAQAAPALVKKMLSKMAANELVH